MTKEIYWDQCQVPNKETIFKRGTFTGIWGKAIETRRTLYSNEGPFNTPKGHIPIENTAATPIIYGDEVISAIHVANKPGGYDLNDVATLDIMAQVIAPVLAARLQRDKNEAERNKAQESLRENRDMMNLMMNSLPVAIFYVDEIGHFQFNNNTHKQWCALTGDEIIGKDYLQVLGEDQYRGTIQKQVETALSGKETAYETSVSYRDGYTRDIAVNYIPHFCEEGKLLGFIGLVQDITGRKAHEKRQAELVQEIRHFAYIVSHDLRAPLTNLIGFSNELESSLKTLIRSCHSNLQYLPTQDWAEIKSLLEEDMPEAIAFIKSSARRMDHLITAILNLPRLGHAELSFERLDMNRLVDHILNSMAYQIAERQARVSVGELPETTGDRFSMEQIMGNLLDNALKYLDPNRPGEISITGWTRGHENVFQILDNGSGVVQADLENIFQVFQRSCRPDIPGEGMGLAHVRTLVRRHGGMIWCESEPNKGATFTFTISNTPLEEPPQTAEHSM